MKPKIPNSSYFGFLVVSMLLALGAGFATLDRELPHQMGLMMTRELFWRVIFRMSLSASIGLGVGIALDTCIIDPTRRFRTLVRLWILLAIFSLWLLSSRPAA